MLWFVTHLCQRNLNVKICLLKSDMRANRLTVSLIAEDLGLFAFIWHDASHGRVKAQRYGQLKRFMSALFLLFSLRLHNMWLLHGFLFALESVYQHAKWFTWFIHSFTATHLQRLTARCEKSRGEQEEMDKWMRIICIQQQRGGWRDWVGGRERKWTDPPDRKRACVGDLLCISSLHL